MKCKTFMDALSRQRELVNHGASEYEKGYLCGYAKGLKDGEQKALEYIKAEFEGKDIDKT